MNESAHTQKSKLIEVNRDSASSAVMRAIIGNRGLTMPRPSQELSSNRHWSVAYQFAPTLQRLNSPPETPLSLKSVLE